MAVETDETEGEQAYEAQQRQQGRDDRVGRVPVLRKKEDWPEEPNIAGLERAINAGSTFLRSTAEFWHRTGATMIRRTSS